METTEKRISKNKALIIYSILFYTIWVIFEFVGKPVIDEFFPGVISSQIIKTVVIKNLVWVLPAALLVHHYKDEVSIGLREMFTAKVDWRKYLPVFLIFTFYPIVTSYLRNGSLRLGNDFGAREVICYSFVGITEEMVFRGWLLNATVGREQQYKWRALLLNAVMFVAIHMPTWYTHGELADNLLHFKFVGIMILGTIFGLTFLKSRNILIPVALHMIWDVMVSLSE